MTAVSVSAPTIHFEVHGSKGPFLFLLHGWCCTHTFWRFQVAQLASRFRVVTLDYEGHGLSGPAVEASRLTIGRFADNVIAAADMLQVEELALMGHSMGGPVAIEAALGLVGRCKFILGVDTFTDDAFYGLRPPDEIEMRVQKFEAHFEDTMIKMVRNITAPQTDPLIIAEITEVMATSNRQVALAALKSLLEWDIEAASGYSGGDYQLGDARRQRRTRSFGLGAAFNDRCRPFSDDGEPCRFQFACTSHSGETWRRLKAVFFRLPEQVLVARPR
jgi:pimeloyl-ACP methyl ester carboxylesterase